MSWQAVTWVLEFSEARLGSRLVLISIASHANREGREAWPSLKTLALESKIDKSQVIRCVRDLEGIGELRVKRDTGRSRTNHYEIPPVAQWVESFHPLSKRVAFGLERVANPVERVAPSHPKYPNRPLNRKERTQNRRARSAVEIEAFNAGPSYR